jgi:hypothetical protein
MDAFCAASADGGAHAIVVVHGVGPRNVGDALESFYQTTVGAMQLTAVDTPTVRLLPPPEGSRHLNDFWARWRRLVHRLLWGPIWPPDEAKPGDALARAALPAIEGVHRRKRFQTYVRTAKDPDGRDVIFAETFWADLSYSKTSLWHLFARLLTIVFHLSYLVDCAAAHSRTRAAKVQRILLWLGSMSLCVPLAGIYFFALYCGGVAMLVGRFGPMLPPSWRARLGPWEAQLTNNLLAAYGAGAVLLGVGIFAFSVRHWRTWGGTWKFVALVFAGIGLIAIACNDFDADVGSVALASFIETALLFGTGFLALATVAFMAAIVLGTGLVLANWGSKSAAAHAAALGGGVLQFVVWSLIVPAVGLWAFSSQGLRQPRIYSTAQTMLIRHMSLVLLPLAGIGLVIAWRFLRFRPLVRKLLGPPTPNSPLYRLLVNPLVIALLIAITFVGGWLYVDSLLRRWQQAAAADSLWAPLPMIDPIIRWDDWLASLPWIAKLGDLQANDGFVTALIVVPAALIGLLLAMQAFDLPFSMRTILHIVNDIISHFYRPVVWPSGPIPFQDHTIQERISERLAWVLWDVHRLARISKLTIVSHSQGTATAILTLNELSDPASRLREKLLERPDAPESLNAWLAGKGPGHVTLVTMGSPFSHLYQHYFPDRYPALYRLEDGVWRWNNCKEAQPGWNDWHRLVDQWINLYRYDDFVGTQIHNDAEHFQQQNPAGAPRLLTPKNRELEQPGGHVRYWDREDVIRKLADVLPGRARM